MVHTSTEPVFDRLTLVKFSHFFRESSYEVIPEKVEPQDSEPVMLDTKFFKLEFKSAKKVRCPNIPGSSRPELKS